MIASYSIESRSQFENLYRPSFSVSYMYLEPRTQASPGFYCLQYEEREAGSNKSLGTKLFREGSGVWFTLCNEISIKWDRKIVSQLLHSLIHY